MAFTDYGGGASNGQSPGGSQSADFNGGAFAGIDEQKKKKPQPSATNQNPATAAPPQTFANMQANGQARPTPDLVSSTTGALGQQGFPATTPAVQPPPVSSLASQTNTALAGQGFPANASANRALGRTQTATDVGTGNPASTAATTNFVPWDGMTPNGTNGVGAKAKEFYDTLGGAAGIDWSQVSEKGLNALGYIGDPKDGNFNLGSLDTIMGKLAKGERLSPTELAYYETNRGQSANDKRSPYQSMGNQGFKFSQNNANLNNRFYGNGTNPYVAFGGTATPDIPPEMGGASTQAFSPANPSVNTVGTRSNLYFDPNDDLDTGGSGGGGGGTNAGGGGGTGTGTGTNHDWTYTDPKRPGYHPPNIDPVTGIALNSYNSGNDTANSYGGPNYTNAPSAVNDALEQFTLGNLKNPSRYSTDAFNSSLQSGLSTLGRQFGAQDKQLDENMARRGISASSFAGGYYGDLKGQQADSTNALLSGLLTNQANNWAADQSAASGSAQNLMNSQNQNNQFFNNLAQQLGIAQMGDRTANRGITSQEGIANMNAKNAAAMQMQSLMQQLGIAKMGDYTQNRGIDTNANASQNQWLQSMMAYLMQLLNRPAGN